MDDNYVITGHTFSNDGDIKENQGESDILLLKINDNGELLWSQTYGGSGFDTSQSVSLTTDGGFLISGNSKSTDLQVAKNAGENDMWVLKTDANGQLMWQENFGGSGIDLAFDAIEDANGGVVIVGSSPSTDFPEIQSQGGSDLIVIRME